MRLAGAVALVLMLGPGLHAATGDWLRIAETRVNMRAGPGLQNGVLATLSRDTYAIELRRAGVWVEVEVELANRKRRGWVHASLLARAPAPVSAALQNLAVDVQKLNQRIATRTGIWSFVELQELDDSVLQITCSDDWLDLGPAERRQHLDELTGFWLRQLAPGAPGTVMLVDNRGQLIMMNSRQP